MGTTNLSSLALSGTLAVTGAATVGGSLTVTGALSSSGALSGTSLTLSSFAAISGLATVGGTLAVTGGSTLSGNVTAAKQIVAQQFRTPTTLSQGDYAFEYHDGTNRPILDSFQMYDRGTNALRTVYLHTGALKVTA